MKIIKKLGKKRTNPQETISLRQRLRFIYLYTLLLCQPLDGILTYMGVSRWGLIAEGNPIVKATMEQLGVISGLLLLKGAGIIMLSLFLIYYDDLFSKDKILEDLILIITTLLYILAIVTWIYVLFGATNVTFG